jgi:cytochrome c-type biogenesis protein CcmH
MRWFLLLLLVVNVPALSVDTEPALPTPALEQRYQMLTHEFRCLVCQDETIADSDASLAADLRAQVYQQLLQGRTDEQIKHYMIARYGDFVLFKPPFQPNTWLLWSSPAILLLVGLAAMVIIVRRRHRFAGDIALDDDNEPRW